jgi:hypothetical protein
MRYVPHPNVVARRLDDTIVLVHLDTSRIFTLNPTGSRVWELIDGEGQEEVDVDTLERRLRDLYHVEDDAQLHGDVAMLLRQLEEERLVVDPEGDPPC